MECSLGHGVSDLLLREVRESESMLYGTASIRGLVRVQGVVTEESADCFSFSFPNERFEVFRVHSNSSPVDEGSGAIEMSIHNSVFHVRSITALRDSHFPRSEILPDPV